MLTSAEIVSDISLQEGTKNSTNGMWERVRKVFGKGKRIPKTNGKRLRKKNPNRTNLVVQNTLEIIGCIFKVL